MPNLSRKVCGGKGCFVITDQPYCSRCKKVSRRIDDRRRRGSKSKYNDARWRKYSAAYRRRHPVCAYCIEEGRRVPRLAQVVDHKVPVELGGSMWDPDNHQGLCNPHHNGRKQREDNALRKRQRQENLI